MDSLLKCTVVKISPDTREIIRDVPWDIAKQTMFNRIVVDLTSYDVDHVVSTDAHESRVSVTFVSHGETVTLSYRFDVALKS